MGEEQDKLGIVEAAPYSLIQGIVTCRLSKQYRYFTDLKRDDYYYKKMEFPFVFERIILVDRSTTEGAIVEGGNYYLLLVRKVVQAVSGNLYAALWENMPNSKARTCQLKTQDRLGQLK